MTIWGGGRSGRREPGSTSYGYDAISRLASLGQQFAGGAGDVTTTLGYNAASQVATRTRSNDDYRFTGYVAADRAYAVNGLNQYTAAGPASFLYDANGNLTSDGTTSYAYDAENRLVSATSAGGTSLSYDPLGRLWKTASTAHGTMQFVYDGDHYDAAQTVTAIQAEWILPDHRGPHTENSDRANRKSSLLSCPHHSTSQLIR